MPDSSTHVLHLQGSSKGPGNDCTVRQVLVGHNASAPAGKQQPIKSADAAQQPQQQQQQQPAQQESAEPGMGGLSLHLAAFTLDLNKFVRHSKLKVMTG